MKKNKYIISVFAAFFLIFVCPEYQLKAQVPDTLMLKRITVRSQGSTGTEKSDTLTLVFQQEGAVCVGYSGFRRAYRSNGEPYQYLIRDNHVLSQFDPWPEVSYQLLFNDDYSALRVKVTRKSYVDYNPSKRPWKVSTVSYYEYYSADLGCVPFEDYVQFERWKKQKGILPLSDLDKNHKD